MLIACGLGTAQETESPEERARAAWRLGYLLHLYGEYERAIERFRESIAIHPTAEAHTFLGGSLSRLGKLEEAIAQCEIAIRLDPHFGNPYNDIGVYPSDLGRPEEAIPWLEKATKAKRYGCYQFPHFNLGRVWLAQGRIEEARRAFKRALEYDPDDPPARRALEVLERSGLRGL